MVALGTEVSRLNGLDEDKLWLLVDSEVSLADVHLHAGPVARHVIPSAVVHLEAVFTFAPVIGLATVPVVVGPCVAESPDKFAEIFPVSSTSKRRKAFIIIITPG